MAAGEDFEERDNLKNMDMIDGEGVEVLGETDPDGRDHTRDEEASDESAAHDHGAHSHSHD